MLTPRAIMVGQYRLVLAVSTGIRAQGHLWALPEHPECPILNSSEFERGAFRDLE